MNYDETIKNLQTLAEIPLNQEDENFKRVIPLMFAYAENRIYRELDFLATTTMTTGVLIAKNRELALPVTVLVLRQLDVIVPSGLPAEPPFSGVVTRLRDTRRTLERISPESVNMFWPQETFRPGAPEKFAIIGKSTPGPPQVLSYIIRLLPTPDKAYPVEFLGVIRPEPLSPTNSETFLSITYPDLLCAACMVFISGYQRDFGAAADDPGKAISWEAQYTALRGGAVLEAARLRGEAAGWSSQPPAPLAAARAP